LILDAWQYWVFLFKSLEQLKKTGGMAVMTLYEIALPAFSSLAMTMF